MIDDLVVRVAHRGADLARITPADVPGAVGRVVAYVAGVLGEVGVGVAVGDLIISGSLARAGLVDPGDEVRVDYGPLGALAVTFTA
jgi:2-keto-4-pentenoate hydratase